jgi:glycopeptide antibiotics resistance protein
LIEAVIAIFGTQPDGTLAGDGVVRAMTFNALLFVSMGYLLLFWFRRLRKNPWLAVEICTAVSVGIELLQEWTGLGMADWKDVVSNALGGAVGVLFVKVSGRWFSCD